MHTDFHQHLWTEPFLEALLRRDELPFARHDQGLTVVFLAGERPFVVDLDAETPSIRMQLAEEDGLDRALLCLSSPLGVEALPRAEASELIDAYHEGALALGEPFGVWGALALDQLRADDVDDLLDRGCVGVSLPAGALAGIDLLARIAPVLARLQSRNAALFVHPGPGTRSTMAESSLGDPLWWPALTRYVADMQAAWLVWMSAARRLFPELRVVFAMLAGLAPLQAERLLARGGPDVGRPDPLVFYDTSSYGPLAIGSFETVLGAEQLVYGSDRPVVDPHDRGSRTASATERHALEHALDRQLLIDSSRRALAIPEGALR